MLGRAGKRHRLAVAAAALALAVALGAGGVASAVTNPGGSGEIMPNTLPKKRFAPVSLHIIVKLITDNPSGLPDPLTNLKLDFDDDGKLTTTGLAKCDPAQIEDTTTEAALAQCGDAQVGEGDALVRVPAGQTYQEFPATLTLFNGLKQNDNPTLVVHARADDLGFTQLVIGTIKDSKAGADFGKALNIPFPTLPANAVLSRFETTIHRTWTADGKRRSYLSARCHDKNRTLNVLATPSLNHQAPRLVGVFDQRCKVK
jgi:hypothetical protein